MESVSPQRVHGTTKRQPRELFEEEEKGKLRPLPGKDYETSLWFRTKVGSSCHIVVENNFYSVPYAFCGKEVTLQVTESLIRVYERINPLSQGEGKVLCAHLRLKVRGSFRLIVRITLFGR